MKKNRISIEIAADNIAAEMRGIPHAAEMAATIAEGISEKASDGYDDFPPSIVGAMERLDGYMKDIRRAMKHAKRGYEKLQVLRAEQIIEDAEGVDE